MEAEVSKKQCLNHKTWQQSKLKLLFRDKSIDVFIDIFNFSFRVFIDVFNFSFSF